MTMASSIRRVLGGGLNNNTLRRNFNTFPFLTDRERARGRLMTRPGEGGPVPDHGMEQSLHKTPVNEASSAPNQTQDNYTRIQDKLTALEKKFKGAKQLLNENRSRSFQAPKVFTKEKKDEPVYGALTNITTSISKGDVVKLFRTSGVRLEDMKYAYNTALQLSNIYIKFESLKAFAEAWIVLKNSPALQYGLIEESQKEWDNVLPRDCKTVVIAPIHPMVTKKDVMECLGDSYSRCIESSIDISPRRWHADDLVDPVGVVKVATVCFPSEMDAENAVTDIYRNTDNKLWHRAIRVHVLK